MNAAGSITRKIAVKAIIVATVILQRCCSRLSRVFTSIPKPTPKAIIPKTTNIKVKAVWETTSGIPACNATIISKDGKETTIYF